MYCLDTDVIIDYLRGEKAIIEKIKELSDEDALFLTTISLCELFKGAYLSSKTDEELPLILEFAHSVDMVSLDLDSCRIFGEEYRNLKDKGKMTNEFDLMIGAIVKAKDLTLVTRNKKHFENISIKMLAL